MKGIKEKLEYLIGTREILMQSAIDRGIEVTPETTFREVAEQFRNVPYLVGSYVRCWVEKDNMVPVSGGRRTLHIVTDGSAWHIDAPDGVGLSATDGVGDAEVAVTIPPMWNAPSDVRLTVTIEGGKQASVEITVFNGNLVFYTDGLSREPYLIGNKTTVYTEVDNPGPYVHNIDSADLYVRFPVHTTEIHNTPYFDTNLDYLKVFRTESHLGSSPKYFHKYYNSGSKPSLEEFAVYGNALSGKTDLSNAFYNEKYLKTVDFGECYLKGVTNMGSMFQNCSSLPSLDLSGWDIGSVTNMGNMFQDCSSLSSLDLSGWDVGSVTNIGNMFQGCSSLPSLDLSGWDIGSVTNMGNMFQDCSSLSSLDLSGWDVGSVTNIGNMFQGCSSLQSLDVSGWDVGSVTNMGNMFAYCSSLPSLDVSSWDVGSVTNMVSMFYGCSSLSSLDVSGWDVGSVTNMVSMFYGCSSLPSLDVSGWDVGSVTNMGNMFQGCSSLPSLDVSGWDVGSVTNMGNMFYGCSSLPSLDLSGWDVGSVTNMGNMFAYCSSLSSLDLSGWDVGSVTNMVSMFYGCSSLSSLDVSGWDIGSVTNMGNMFYGCSALTTIKGPITGINANLGVSSGNLTRDSAMVLINGLADRTGQAACTLALSTSTKKLLSAADIAIASAKNWTIA